MRNRFGFAIALLALTYGSNALAGKTRTVVLIISDCVRPEEMCGGAELELINKSDIGGWYSADELRKRFYDPDPKKSRKLLFPFIWGTVAAQGQIFGNAALGSR